MHKQKSSKNILPFGMAFWKEPIISTYSEVLNSTIFCCLKFWYKRIVNGCFSILKPERFGCLEGMRPAWAINPTIQKVANSKNERSQLWLNRIYSSHRSASVSRLWSQNIPSTLASKTGIIRIHELRWTISHECKYRMSYTTITSRDLTTHAHTCSKEVRIPSPLKTSWQRKSNPKQKQEWYIKDSWIKLPFYQLVHH